MNHITTRLARAAVALASLALVATAIPAVAQSDDAATASMAVEVAGLSSGETVTDNSIDLTVQPVGYELSNTAGTPPVDGVGHYHVILDGGLINMFATPEASVSLQNVAPGPHTLMVVPAMNDHMEAMDGAAAIEFDYQPTEPLPEISVAESGNATPAIEIVAPASGTEVAGSVEFTVSVSGFTLSEGLLGKPIVPGFGHWHLFIDAAEGMGTMAGMSGTDSLTYDTSGLAPGPHTFIAVLTDNLHAPLDPMAMATVELEVVSAESQAGSAQTIQVSLFEWGLEPSDLTLAPGTYTFAGTNDGTMPHALALEGEGISAATPDASYPPGESQSFTVNLAPGTYEIFCPIPGHRQAGMVATITVSG